MQSPILFLDLVDADGHPVLVNVNGIDYVRPFTEEGQELLEIMVHGNNIFVAGTMEKLHDTLKAITEHMY